MPEADVKEPDQFTKADKAKVVIDYLKHLTTLSSGSIMVLATFIDKFQHPKVKWLLIYGMTGLAVSLMTSIIGILGMTVYGAEAAKRTSELDNTLRRFLNFSAWGFLTGIYCVAMYAIFNLL